MQRMAFFSASAQGVQSQQSEPPQGLTFSASGRLINKRAGDGGPMLLGVSVRDIRKVVDERGYFAEVLRDDWKDLLEKDRVLQTNVSRSLPGIVRAWHRHSKGQVDYLVVLEGIIKVCVYDDQDDSPTRGHLEEIVASSEKLQVVRIPGHYWHGTKNLGFKPSTAMYFVTRLYDTKDPDEERRAWNDPDILDPKTGKPFDWNKPPHK